VFPESEGPAFACHIVDVEGRSGDGEVQILRYTTLQDVGKAIHPSYVEGKFRAAIAGHQLGPEREYVYDAEVHAQCFLDYQPTALDADD
jgi:CO/xanthine dehydrogenase Mo-binding subunit